MKTVIWLFAATAWLCLRVLAATNAAPNLLANGDFEAGDRTPANWQTIDGLTSFWVQDPDPGHGKVLKFDTDVLQKQTYEWWARIAAGANPADAPAKLPTVEPKYDTLAAFDGAWFYSDPLPVEPGKAYWLSLDVKGPEIMVWLLGYTNKPTTAFGAEAAAFQGYLGDQAGTHDIGRGHQAFIHEYDWKGQLKAGGPGEWRTYARRAKPFRPTANTPQVRFMRVQLLPYWPPAVYYVDNVRLVEVPGASAAAGATGPPAKAPPAP